MAARQRRRRKGDLDDLPSGPTDDDLLAWGRTLADQGESFWDPTGEAAANRSDDGAGADPGVTEPALSSPIGHDDERERGEEPDVVESPESAELPAPAESPESPAPAELPESAGLPESAAWAEPAGLVAPVEPVEPVAPDEPVTPARSAWTPEPAHPPRSAPLALPPDTTHTPPAQGAPGHATPRRATPLRARQPTAAPQAEHSASPTPLHDRREIERRQRFDDGRRSKPLVARSRRSHSRPTQPRGADDERMSEVARRLRERFDEFGDRDR